MPLNVDRSYRSPQQSKFLFHLSGEKASERARARESSRKRLARLWALLTLQQLISFYIYITLDFLFVRKSFVENLFQFRQDFPHFDSSPTCIFRRGGGASSSKNRNKPRVYVCVYVLRVNVFECANYQRPLNSTDNIYFQTVD